MDEFGINYEQTSPSTSPLAQEEFFESALFQDILEMKSVAQVSEKTASNIKDLQDEVYQTLFDVFQKTRGINVQQKAQIDEMSNIFELFFKNYYWHFRSGMEEILADKSPLKVAYYLGKNSDKLLTMLNQFIREMGQEI